jgi:hypothetical protein
MGTLLDAVWGDVPPDTAVKTLQKYISQLRTELSAPGLIESKADGYQLVTRDVDSRRFEELIDRAESEPAPDVVVSFPRPSRCGAATRIPISPTWPRRTPNGNA